MHKIIYCLLILIGIAGCRSNDQVVEQKSTDTLALYSEAYRPQLHFSPKGNWMNDPNGMVYYKGEYHLFYQHYPDGLVWGPMHWGHAVTTDLVHWEHLPIALYPDSLGLIFSGSAVVDENNTSGFGTAENPPLVAIFTYHSMEKEKKGDTDYQNQGIAYSTDSGRTWIKYENNPVLKNQGIKDFRDPKVFWHAETKKWIMTLAVKDHVELWGSPNLKSWNKLSEFGSEYGAHGGVWECPDFFPAKIEGESGNKWLMLVSINPGGPNGGSATQYFTGDFDGTTFKCDTDKQTTNWLDYGPDDYAGVTWFNAPEGRRIFLGWMSNWAYAQAVPTSPWRSAMTTPRDITLTKVGNKLYARSTVAAEFMKTDGVVKSVEDVMIQDSLAVSNQYQLDFSKAIASGSLEAKDFALELSNSAGQKLTVGFDQKANRFFIDRSKSGKVDFSEGFRQQIVAPRISSASKINFTLVADVSSIEIFFDDGLTVMTSLFFSDEPLSEMTIRSAQPIRVENFQVKELKSIW
jgi:fructan beta-fructosidase